MAKGDEAKIKKKNKAMRKKLNKDPSTVSSRVASIIASKKRRQSGKRSRCQGMCFSLPSLDDPYNDQHGKADTGINRKKRPLQSNKESLKNTGDKQLKKTAIGDQENIDYHIEKRLDQKELENLEKTSIGNLEKREKSKVGKRKTQSFLYENQTLEISGCPSKFTFMCLNTIRDSLLGDGELNDEELDEPLFVKSWGFNFWKFYSMGHDILEISGSGASVQQIAWMTSTAADSISQMEKEGISSNSPFLIYLVPSKEKALKVRSICKPLKVSGLHTVIIHPGTSVEHQVQGLKSCEPEFLVATPERLWELVLMKAVDISRVSFLIVDGIDSLFNRLDVVRNIRGSISGRPCTIVFQGSYGGSSAQAVQNILREPFQTLSLEESIGSPKVSNYRTSPFTRTNSTKRRKASIKHH